MVGLTSAFEATYTEVTFRRIINDAIFFRRQIEETNDEQKRRCYARIVILLMALYLESMANLLFDELVNKDLDLVDKKTDLPRPIRKFRAIHKGILKTLPRSKLDGVTDIFTIRNKVIAHPPGIAKLKTDGTSQIRIDRKVSYHKFSNFPVMYSHFAVSEADIIIDEVRGFLMDFLNSLKPKITNEQFNKWWPKELVDFKAEAPTVVNAPDKELLKSDSRWWITMVFNFFTVLVFGMALIALVVNMENVALHIENVVLLKEARWIIGAYWILAHIFVVGGCAGMAYFVFRANRAAQRQRGKH